MPPFLLANAVFLSIGSATRSGYVLSEPEVEHEPECPLHVFNEEDEDEDESEDVVEECDCESGCEKCEPRPVRTACSCRVLGYDIVEVGMALTQSDREDAADNAVSMAVDLGAPLIVVREHWTPHGMSNATFESLLINWGKWEAALENAGAHMDMVVKALPDTWRRPLFGNGKHNPEQWKQLAKTYVTQALKLPPYGEDISEALCIREWGSGAAEVHQLLFKG